MRRIGLVLLIVVALFLFRLNFKLYSGGGSHASIKSDILTQLNFLEYELKENNLDVRMQSVYPEGLVFINALYGLTWCELALSDLEDSELKEKAIREALFAYGNIDEDRAKWSFQKDLEPEYGIFYNGWRNYLLSKILSIDTTFSDAPHYLKKFRAQSDQISKAIENSPTPFLESYVHLSWPADTYVAMASLSNYDQNFSPQYQSVKEEWLTKVKARLDLENSMLPHGVDYQKGETLEGARGSSMALMLRFLVEIDREFGKEQYQLFEEHFVTSTMGFPSVREYPKGKNGYGDIDSGPVLFGVGFAATIVSISTFAVYENSSRSRSQYETITAFGFDMTMNNQKKYLFGVFPMGDAFIAWGRATALNWTEENESDFWQWKFNLGSLIFLLLLWMFYFRKTIRRYIK